MFLRGLRQQLIGRARLDARPSEQAAQRAVRRAVDASVTPDPLPATDRPDDQFELRWRDSLKARVVFVLCVLGLWSVAVEVRLIHLQIFQHHDLKELAERQQERVVKLVPPRGDIVDRNGQMLAYSIDGNAVVADPGEIENPQAATAEICQALGNCDAARKAAILSRLTRKGSFSYVDRQASPEQAARIDALKLQGIRILSSPGSRRYYPRAELGAHVLGFVGIDNEGLGGVEKVYDDVIRGTEGQMLMQVDARRKSLDSRLQRAPTSGATVELTLDMYLQHIAERELQAGVERTRAEGGTAVIMDPQNGEILALASFPTFDPNAFRQFSDSEKRNRALQDVYEPGSTFKIVTASAALEDGLVHLDDLIDTNPGRITFPGRKPITEAKGHNYGVLTVEDVIVRSSNIGAIKIGLKVGAERLSRYIQNFGFGQALLPDLAGQSRGIVYNASKINDSALASMSMGYQIGVTPVQMATAASAVANGGTLFQPHVVRAVVRDGHREPVPIKPLRRVISTETAAMMTTIMEGVVGLPQGTGSFARLDGFQVAGKTGTAAKLVGRAYSSSAYNCSFIGFVPSRQPVFTILVVIDTPRAGSPYGGPIAGPIFQRIADAALRQMAVPPTINPPPVILASDGHAGSAQTVRGPVVRPTLTPVGGTPVMPDVVGLSARDALRVLTAAGLTVRVVGTGIVDAQTPAPGVPLDEVDSSTLELSRHPKMSGGTR